VTTHLPTTHDTHPNVASTSSRHRCFEWSLSFFKDASPHLPYLANTPPHRLVSLPGYNTRAMTSPFRPAAPAESLPAYYDGLGDETIQHCFRNFDNVENFDLFDRQTRNPKSVNFCLDFGEREAFCAFDLDAQAYSKLLASPRPPFLHTRWINIWMPYNQKDLMKVLGQYFDFTPRLLGMMRSDPCPPRSQSMRKRKSSSTLRSMLSHMSNKSDLTKQRAKEANQATMDSEESIGMTELMHSTQLEMVQDLSHYQLVDDVWHWSTVDWGRRCMLPHEIQE
jgi:hypothetical protein